MTDFKNIKTRYVKENLKGREYNEENVEYIQDLMFIERVISGEKINYIAGMKLESLKHKYNTEFLEILKEISPEGYKKYLEEEEQRKRKLEESRKERAIKEKLEENLSRESWGEVSRE